MLDIVGKLKEKFEDADAGSSVDVLDNKDLSKELTGHLDRVTEAHGSNHSDHHGSSPELQEERK